MLYEDEYDPFFVHLLHYVFFPSSFCPIELEASLILTIICMYFLTGWMYISWVLVSFFSCLIFELWVSVVDAGLSRGESGVQCRFWGTLITLYVVPSCLVYYKFISDIKSTLCFVSNFLLPFVSNGQTKYQRIECDSCYTYILYDHLLCCFYTEYYVMGLCFRICIWVIPVTLYRKISQNTDHLQMVQINVYLYTKN